MNSRKQSITDIKSEGPQTCESPQLQSAEPTESQQQDRKRYNIISEELRKQIIHNLTVDKKSIKEVSKQFSLKLSTCKAILQVYLKEGRIGKKTTRDRKSKIINTLLVATINPLNPLQSTLTPFVQISEFKCSQKNMEENDVQSSLITEAVQKASNQLSGVFDNNNNSSSQHNNNSNQNNNNTENNNVNIPQDSLNMLQNVFMQTQMQTLNQFLFNSGQSNQQSPAQFSMNHQNLFNNLVGTPLLNPLNNNNIMNGDDQTFLDGNLDLNSNNNIEIKTPLLAPHSINNNKNVRKYSSMSNFKLNNNKSNNNTIKTEEQEQQQSSEEIQKNSNNKSESQEDDEDEEEDEDIDNQIVETIQKKIFQEKSYLRKNSIIISNV